MPCAVHRLTPNHLLHALFRSALLKIHQCGNNSHPCTPHCTFTFVLCSSRAAVLVFVRSTTVVSSPSRIAPTVGCSARAPPPPSRRRRCRLLLSSLAPSAALALSNDSSFLAPSRDVRHGFSLTGEKPEQLIGAINDANTLL